MGRELLSAAWARLALSHPAHGVPVGASGLATVWRSSTRPECRLVLFECAKAPYPASGIVDVGWFRTSRGRIEEDAGGFSVFTHEDSDDPHLYRFERCPEAEVPFAEALLDGRGDVAAILDDAAAGSGRRRNAE